jgi:hypothetical protein
MSHNWQRSGAQPHRTPSENPSEDHVPEETLQTHVWLTPGDLQILDARVLQMRHNGWRRATRLACIRAVVSLINEHPLDLESVTNEQELEDKLRVMLQRKLAG